MTMRFATEMEMEMEMRMIKKEASKTPAYSPRVESHVVSNNLERSICLSHPAPPMTHFAPNASSVLIDLLRQPRGMPSRARTLGAPAPPCHTYDTRMPCLP